MKNFIKERKIERVVHFTTNIGLIGILATGNLLSREKLSKEKHLCHIMHNNCEFRVDHNWTSYVSMSIQNPNKMFFEAAANWDHNRNFWWCILSFNPEIIEHDGVVFCSTNNAYSENVLRGTGVDGIKLLYADVVKEKFSYVKTRNANTPLANPTSPQAEILYPNSVGLEFLDTIFIPSEDYEPDLQAYLAGAQRENIKYTIDKSLFI